MFLSENFSFFIKESLDFVLDDRIMLKSVSGEVMASYRECNKPIPKPIVI